MFVRFRCQTRCSLNFNQWSLSPRTRGTSLKSSPSSSLHTWCFFPFEACITCIQYDFGFLTGFYNLTEQAEMLRTRTAIKLSSLSSTSRVAIGMRNSVSGIRSTAVGRGRGQVVIVLFRHRVKLIYI